MADSESPPIRLARPDAERRATWLELLYDLVYIATVIQLGSYLHHHLTVAGAAGFLFLFLIVWWSWSGTTYYTNRFVVDDPLHRLLVFGQIFAVGTMATAIPGAFGESGAAFALAYAAGRVLLIGLYLRALRWAPESRKLVRRYLSGFGAGIALFALSALLPAEWRPWLWALGLAVEVAVHLLPGTQAHEDDVPFNLPHLSERYALFVLIVLGDSFIKGIGRVAEEGITAGSYVYGALAVAMTVGLWWVYFDDVASARLKQGRDTTPWVYGHLALCAAVVGFGVAVDEVTQLPFTRPAPPEVLWTLCLSVGAVLLVVGVIDAFTEGRRPAERVRIGARVGSAALLVGVAAAGGALAALAAVALVVAIVAAQVALDLAAGGRRTA